MYALLMQPTEAQMTKVTQLYTLACLVNVYLEYAAGDLLHFIFRDRKVVKILGELGLHFVQILSVWQNWFDF